MKATYETFNEPRLDPSFYAALLQSLNMDTCVIHDWKGLSALLKKKDAETQQLLKLSYAISTIRNKEDLVSVINKNLRALFNFENVLILILSDDPAQYSFVFSSGHFDGENLMPDIKGFDITDYSLNCLQKVLEHDGVLIYDMETIAQNESCPAYLKTEYENGIKEKVTVTLQKGDKCLGVCCINTAAKNSYNAHDLELIKAISYQLSTAVSNILANEKIHNQIEEINNYKQQLEEETFYLKEEIDTAHNYTEIIGESACMQKIFRMISQVSFSDSTVLLLGETGTGKELIARAIHNNSPRKNKLMVKVNCAALPANLIESELFGHERGSFTGATDRRLGKFELANGGTLFLDEIGEMPIDLQVKLLRALQEKEIERIGGRTTIKVDVRIIAATNRDLEKEMDEGRFRSDLFYRLNIFPITLPPLRERLDDIPLLTQHFINRFAKKIGKKIKALSHKALQDMLLYNWPGNIRELEHLVERSILLCDQETIKHIHLPVKKHESSSKTQHPYFPIKTMEEYEREYILKVLKHCKGRVGGFQGCADLLDIPASTLFSRMKKLGIKREMIVMKGNA